MMTRAVSVQAVEEKVPLLLSLNGGYVDTMSFLTLRGLFAAHVTGNFVTLGAALVLGTSGAIAKLLALPLFCVVVIAARLLSYVLKRKNLPVLRSLLLIKLLLLTIAAAFAVTLGPFSDGDSISALLTGMTLVAAMAIQNAAHRVHLPKSPPSTLMTGTTTQIMLDLADIIHGEDDGAAKVAKGRMWTMSQSLLAFAAGCAAAALLYALGGEASFFFPPVVAVLTLVFVPRDDKPTSP